MAYVRKTCAAMLVTLAISSPALASERLRFRATWNGVPVARGELLVEPASASAGEVALVGRAETNEFLDLLWRMRDSFEATVDERDARPRRFVLRQNENGKHRTSTITRDADGARLVGESRKRNRPPRTTVVPVGEDLHDPASVAYAIRALPRDSGPVTYRVFNGRRTYELHVAPVREETVEAARRQWPARKFDLALQLAPESEGAPKRLGVQRAELWVSTDEARLPLRLQATTFWGWVVVELVGRGGPALRSDA